MILFLSFLLCAKSSRGWTWSGSSSGQLTPSASSPVMSRSPSSSSIFRLFSRQNTPSEGDIDEMASQSTNFIRMNSPRVFHPSQSVAIINHSRRFNHRSGVIIAHHKHDLWRIRMNDSGSNFFQIKISISQLSRWPQENSNFKFCSNDMDFYG